MIVAADLEGTVTTGATWRGAGRYFLTFGPVWEYRLFFALRFPGALLVKAGILDEVAMRDRWMSGLTSMMRGYDEERLRTWAEWIVEHELWPKRRPEVVAELEAHRRGGARVLLVSGTMQHVLDAFARRIGVEALGTAVRVADSPPQPRMLAPFNSGPVKVERIRAAAPGESLSVAYGDSLGDLPMLEASQGPVAVQPAPALRRIARERGWRIL